MSCGCSQTPCSCESPCGDEDPCANICLEEDVNPNPACGSKCNKDRSNNLWYVADQPTAICKCKLDEITYGDVVEVLERNPFAARDLMKITDDPCLLKLARTVKLRRDPNEDDQIVMDKLNARTLPFYTLFKGNVGGDL